ncbi:IclR family transcriptional regulator [Hirschia baltica]|uniref:Transcriptional regulator, IclR family n=1 Tax=Hirschia baltica (strain ATCC 49814 / DSM 5838 / IFAM 1418) TaxID=582402 RepID=C6XP57_HIRBI|nr:IclR family transcriptional regulator [Hirschia baltica]ACT60237.1 transcriptional regulator, IclR family [Hirschia baltica ATCC 49814]
MLVKQAVNTLQILEYFSERLKPATLAEIADDLSWPRSSTFNIVGTLVEKGYLYQPHIRGAYYPSPRWLTLSQIINDAAPLPKGVLELLQNLATATKETVIIAAPSGINAIFLAVIESQYSVRYSAKVGDNVPIHASSAGRSLLSQMSREQRTALYRKINFIQFSPNSPTTVEQVEEKLELSAARGYHQSHAEYVRDLVGVAIPLNIPDRNLSIIVVGPISRCLEERDKIAVIMKKEILKFKKGNLAR